jgi:hypothetical protein
MHGDIKMKKKSDMKFMFVHLLVNRIVSENERKK